MKSKNKRFFGKFWKVLFFIILFVLVGAYFGLFSFSKPAVVLHLSPNSTEILGFTYAKSPGTLQCVACTNFFGRVEVYHQNNLVCNESESTISLGEVILPVRCDKALLEYEGKPVLVKAVGRVSPIGNKPLENRDEKELILEFMRN